MEFLAVTVYFPLQVLEILLGFLVRVGLTSTFSSLLLAYESSAKRAAGRREDVFILFTKYANACFKASASAEGESALVAMIISTFVIRRIWIRTSLQCVLKAGFVCSSHALNISRLEQPISVNSCKRPCMKCPKIKWRLQWAESD